MKVLMVTEAYAPRIGGGVRCEVTLVKFLRRQGHLVDVLTVNDTNRLEVVPENGGEVIRFPRHIQLDSANLSAGMLLWFLRFCDGYDVFHFNFPNPMGELSHLLARLRGKTQRARKIVHIHGEIDADKPLSKLYRQLVANPFLHAVDHIIVSSPNMFQSSMWLRAVQSKVSIIPYGIDIQTMRGCEVAKSSRLIADLNLDPSRPIFLFVGRLVYYKGIDILLGAFVNVPGNLLVVGTGPLAENLRGIRNGVGLQENVKFLGYVSDEDLVSLYALADVFVLPSVSRAETFGYVLLEAMCNKTAVITTEIGTGTSFINTHQVTGLVIPPRDISALSKAMRDIVADRERLEEYKQNAHSRVMAMFTEERMLDHIYSLYV